MQIYWKVYKGKEKRMNIRSIAILTISVLLAASITPIPRAAAEEEIQIPEFLVERIALWGGYAMFLVAEALDLPEIMGKPLGEEDISSGDAFEPTTNVGIGIDGVGHENEPTVVAGDDDDNLVAGSHFVGVIPGFPELGFDAHCVAYFSQDGGATWSAPTPMPQLTSDSSCSDPVLAFADGRFYYAYMDIKFFSEFAFPLFTFGSDFDILVSFSDDGGATWTGPSVALDGDPFSITINLDTGQVDIDPGFNYDKNWIATHPDDDDFVYVTATRFDNFLAFPDPGDCHIAFTRSNIDDGGLGPWSPPALLDSSSGGCANPVVVQGSRPTAGYDGDVLVAWYNSGDDGWLEGSFEIRTRHSGDNGATWDPTVTAVVDSFEAPFWLGPFVGYHRWWGTMFPDVEIGEDGRAHIVYTHDPEENPFPGFSDTAEDGDVRIVSSQDDGDDDALPYVSWSAPVTLNDDGGDRAQGYAALEAQGSLHVIWEDHRLSSADNLEFDIFYTTMEDDDDKGWSANTRITTASSTSDFSFIGDYNDITVGDDDLVFAIWTDRRHQASKFAFEDNVFGDRIAKADD